MEKSREILQRIWGYSKFRPLQEEIVDSVIYGHDTLALLPTGGGKSICFQVPGIAREGITIVITPLIALMQDQVKNLVNKGIKAKAIMSGMSYREIDIALDNARFGAIDFLYVSPERLTTTLFIERFKLMKVGLIVVDEAHCISEWGHDFRPPYLQIFKLREIHPSIPIIALTATATTKVKEDIATHLKLKDYKYFEGPFERKNLHYFALETENKIKKIIAYCHKYNQETGIIYCQTRKSVKELAKLLHQLKISVGIYHGGMEGEDRKIMLDSWLKGDIKVMIATNAFGMGIDKPNVRFVLHYEFPNNLEAYFQEAGRAGRDEQDAKCIVFWEEKDIENLRRRVNLQFTELESIKLTYRAICNYLKIAIGSGKDETYPIDLLDFCSKFHLDTNTVFNSLKILELSNLLSFSEGTFQPTKLRIAIGNRELYSFQIKHENFAPLINHISRSYPGIFDDFHTIIESDIAKRIKSNHKEVTNQLSRLEKQGIIDITWKTSKPTVTFIEERLPDDYLSISPEVYLKRKERALSRLESAISYLRTEECRVVHLLKYFNQKTENCGTCDYCLSIKIKPKDIKDQIIKLLVQPMEFDEILSHFNKKSKEIIEILQDLMTQEIITENDGVFQIKK